MAIDRAQSAAEEFNRFAERTATPSRCDPTLSFETPKLGHALAIWREKAGGRAMPQRRDMGPRALKSFLPNIAIIDAIADNGARRYRFRLVGTAVADVLGDHTGRFIDEAIAPPFRERWTAIADTAMAAGAPLRLAGRVEYNNRDYLSMEILFAPLASHDGNTEAILMVAYARSSRLHVFKPMVKDTVSVRG